MLTLSLALIYFLQILHPGVENSLPGFLCLIPPDLVYVDVDSQILEFWLSLADDLAGPVAFSALFRSTTNPPFQIWHHERHPSPQFLDQQSRQPSLGRLFLCIVCRYQDSPVSLAVASAKTLLERRAENVKLKQR